MRTPFVLPALAALLAAATVSPAQNAAPPVALKGLTYDAPFFPGAKYNPAVPTPDSVLRFRLGDKAATHSQIEAVIKAIAAKSPRVRLFEYAKTHEGRTLYYLAVGSEKNIHRLDELKKDAAKLADPRLATVADTDALAQTMPAIAWMAYCIHGDEMSGSDASLALLYHLAAGTDKDVTDLLDNVLVLIDPLMNPDGRDRCITGINQNRTVQPSVDDQGVIHAQVWPSGRMNHYLFDMNRDWIFGSQPESRGRIRAAGEWNPHYFMESHEMGSQDTFLFMPARAPINPNFAPHIREWQRQFAADHAHAFDARAWRYYTGEWNEGWYPGYSGSWGALNGAIDNLYEQANVSVDAVRRQEGTLEPYREGVHRQLVASWANLSTLAKNRQAILKAYVEDRRGTMDAGRPGAARAFLIAPGDNPARLRRFIDLMALQRIEVFRTGADTTVSGRDWLGREFKDRVFSPGTLVIPARQPLGRLAAALLELDPRMPESFLVEERRELLRFGRSRLYDITGWNVAMFYGLEAWEADVALPADAARVTPDSVAPPPATPEPADPIGVSLGNDDAATSAAARLMERGVRVRCLDKATVFAGTALPRGCVLVLAKDNQDLNPEWAGIVSEVAGAFGATRRPFAAGLGEGDLPDIGGEHVVLLEAPRVAVLSRDPFSPYSTGEIWHLLDHEVGMRIALLNASDLGGFDLRRYNVLVVPDGSTQGWSDHVGEIRSWVEAGGTLIAIGDSAGAFAKEGGIGSTRLLPDILTKLDDYRAAIVRDYLGKTAAVKPDEVWSNTVSPKLEYPWTLGESDKPSDEEAKRRDQWRAMFSPQGAFLAARVDDRHWLTAGCAEILPVLVGGGPVLIPKFGGNAPLLLGAFVDAPPPPPPPEPVAEKPENGRAPGPDHDDDKDDDEDDDKKDEKPPPPGWTIAPPGKELRLRMSGLLWPEAADRLAHSAYVTQERVGRGQVVLFAGSPTFRAGAPGTTRVFLNAAVLGPGMGASQPIRP
ncbi:hypothetical protein PHYC_03298 [Phycisphaerales bacterium]|nr:hypothetical protein PHYC_03298 [Phycisphaerales bacterium]